jgi:hypothetical protein
VPGIRSAPRRLDTELASAWGHDRADVVVIRLGHRGDTYFSAGTRDEEFEEGDEPFPRWPPAGPPAEGWFTPDDEAI